MTWDDAFELAQVRRRLAGYPDVRGPRKAKTMKPDHAKTINDGRVVAVAGRWQDGQPTPGWDVRTIFSEGEAVGIFLTENDPGLKRGERLHGFVPFESLAP